MRRAGLALAAVILLSSATLGGCGRSDGSGGGGSRTVIQNKGSDTLVNVAQAWAEAYKTVAPNVADRRHRRRHRHRHGGADQRHRRHRQRQPQDRARGAGDGEEGRAPTRASSWSATTRSPSSSTTTTRSSRSRSSSSPRSTAKAARSRRWSDLGVEVPGCPSDEIVLVSRQNNSGTYTYFREAVLGTRPRLQARARATCTAPRTSSTWWRRRRAPSATAASPTPSRDPHALPAQRRGRLRRSDHRDRARRQLPDRAPALHVHAPRARGSGQGVPRLDPVGRRTVHPARSGLRARCRPTSCPG